MVSESNNNHGKTFQLNLNEMYTKRVSSLSSVQSARQTLGLG